MSPHILPPVWSAEALAANIRKSTNRFRRVRLKRPVSNYLKAFDVSRPAVVEAVTLLESFRSIQSTNKLRKLIRSRLEHTEAKSDLLDALRHLVSPPLSADDFKTLVGSKLNPKSTEDLGVVRGLRTVLRAAYDPRRFPWMTRNDGVPAKPERSAAILATTSLLATQRSQTKQRAESSAALEAKVLRLILREGYILAKSSVRNIQLPKDGPAPGQVVRKQTVQGHSADIFVGLKDGRWLLIECKVSNSEINSRKRINKDFHTDAKEWARMGQPLAIPVVVIDGVFKREYLEAAQAIPAYIVWAHDLGALRDFIRACA